MEENAGGAELQLAPDDVNAIRKLSESVEVKSPRYPEAFMKAVEGNYISLRAGYSSFTVWEMYIGYYSTCNGNLIEFLQL